MNFSGVQSILLMVWQLWYHKICYEGQKAKIFQKDDLQRKIIKEAPVKNQLLFHNKHLPKLLPNYKIFFSGLWIPSKDQLYRIHYQVRPERQHLRVLRLQTRSQPCHRGSGPWSGQQGPLLLLGHPHPLLNRVLNLYHCGLLLYLPRSPPGT